MGSSGVGKPEKVAMWLGIVGNALLFCGKIVVGLLFDSISIISDSLNSLTDVVASLVVFVSIKSSYMEADQEHPYGHKRAQPIAGLVVAIFTCIVGFEVVTQSVTRFFTGEQMEKGILPMVLVVGVMLTKLTMHLYVRVVARNTRSTALKASATDHRNDVLVSGAVLVGVVVSNLGFPVFDPVVAISIGLWIIKAGFGIGRDNIKYLIGEAPSAELLETIRAAARSVPGVLDLNDVVAHSIGKKVQRAIEAMDEVSRAFNHIDPLEVS